MSSCKVNWHVESSLIFQVQPDAAKIVCVDEHPANPWIVTCHDNGLVKLWNYQQNKLLHTFNLEKDDSLKREKLQRLIPLNQQSKSFEKPKLGVIHSVRFFDTDVQKYRFLTAQRIAAREGVQLNLNTDFHFCSWIVVNADNRIIFLNYITLQQKELKLSDLDGKVQNCFTPLGVGPLIAFGGVDGVIRVWDSRSWSVVDRLSVTSGHKSVQHILAVINAKGEPVIVSGGSEGHLFWWRGSGTPLAKKSLGEITDLSYNPITGEVISSSNDKSHNLVSWHNIMTGDFEGQVKERLSAKTVYNRVSRFSHPRFPFHSLLACTSNDSRIFLLNKDGSASELFDISELPAGRKQSKIYDLRSHPNFPHLVFCCTRTSFYVMSISASCTPPYSLTQPKERKSGSRRHSPKVVYLASGAPTQLIVSGLKKKGKSLSQKLSYPYARLSSSNSGRYLGVFSPEEEYYQILDLHNYDKSSSTWNVIGEGKARDLVWFGPKDQDMFCIIGLKTEEKEEKIKKNRLIIPSTNKRITVEKQIQELQMGKIDDNAKITYVPTPSVSNCEVTALHGGLVIGFHLDAELHNPILDLERAKKKETNSSSSVRSKNSSTKKKNSTISFDVNPSPVGDSTKSNDRCMRWIFETDPGTVQKIDCPNPLWLLWDPLERYCLLVYSHHFTIVELRPNFKPLFHSRIQILSGVWYKNALIYYTGNTIECKFLGMIPLIIASSDAEVALDLMEQYDSENIAQHIVPLGALSLIEVNDDILYAIDSISNIYQFPLSSPQIQFYFLVAGDQPKSAIELVDSFPENQHISLAQFLCSSGYAEDAVQIKSLSALTRIKICKQYELKDCIPSLIDEFNEEAAKSGTQEEAVKFIRQLCTELQNDELCLNILMKAVQMDETFEKDIILHYAATGAKKKLRSMYDELLEKKKYDSCVFCAQFLNETKLLSQVLQESSQIADYVAFFANDSGVDIESISQQLDIALQKDQPNNRDEYCTTDDDLQQ